MARQRKTKKSRLYDCRGRQRAGPAGGARGRARLAAVRQQRGAVTDVEEEQHEAQLRPGGGARLSRGRRLLTARRTRRGAPGGSAAAWRAPGRRAWRGGWGGAGPRLSLGRVWAQPPSAAAPPRGRHVRHRLVRRRRRGRRSGEPRLHLPARRRRRCRRKRLLARPRRGAQQSPARQLDVPPCRPVALSLPVLLVRAAGRALSAPLPSPCRWPRAGRAWACCAGGAGGRPLRRRRAARRSRRRGAWPAVGKVGGVRGCRAARMAAAPGRWSGTQQPPWPALGQLPALPWPDPWCLTPGFGGFARSLA